MSDADLTDKSSSAEPAQEELDRLFAELSEQTDRKKTETDDKSSSQEEPPKSKPSESENGAFGDIAVALAPHVAEYFFKERHLQHMEQAKLRHAQQLELMKAEADADEKTFKLVILIAGSIFVVLAGFLLILLIHFERAEAVENIISNAGSNSGLGAKFSTI